jgi:hypothetical protein
LFVTFIIGVSAQSVLDIYCNDSSCPCGLQDAERKGISVHDWLEQTIRDKQAEMRE